MRFTLPNPSWCLRRRPTVAGLLSAAAIFACPASASGDSLFPLTREKSVSRSFEITGCGTPASRSLTLPRGAYAVQALRPVVGAALRDDYAGEVFARVADVTLGSQDGRPVLTVTAIGSDAGCKGQTDAEREECAEFGDSCPVLGYSEPMRLTARYTRRERVYVTGTGRGDSRAYKPRVLPFGMRSAIVALRWRKWGSPRAVGRGWVEYNNCVPDCARARPSYYPVRAVLSRRGECDGYAQYLRLRFRYTTASRPPGLPAGYKENLGWHCD